MSYQPIKLFIYNISFIIDIVDFCFHKLKSSYDWLFSSRYIGVIRPS